MIHRNILHNRRICSSSESVLAPGQLGLMAGWGVFTTLRVTDGVLFAWERHWARMLRDAELTFVPMPDPEVLQRDLMALVEANGKPDCSMRLVIIRNAGGPWEGPQRDRACDVVAMTADFKNWGDSARLTVELHGRHAASRFAGTKVNSWAMNLAWVERARQAGFDEVILLNERGEVAELTSANIFAVKGEEVWTPPLDSGCLPGITREVLLRDIAAGGIRVLEKTLRIEDLLGADEVFITSSTRDLLAVREIGGHAIRREGRVMPVLQAAFRAYLESYVRQHASVPLSV